MMANNVTIRLAMRLELDRFLNTWLREFQPAVSHALRPDRDVEIPVGDLTIVAKCSRYSPGGFHRFHERLVVRDRDGSGPVKDVSALATLLLTRQADISSEQIADVLHRLRQSSAASAEHAIFQAAGKPGVSAIELEQSLWFGHPFHPLAKSVGGFGEDDTRDYAPERAARFQLRWLLVHRCHVAEYQRDRQRLAELDLLLLAASGLSQHDLGDYVLFPCHPWQARLLEADPDIASHIRTGEMRLIGTHGDVAVPTSSVRTVWFPERKLFVKLPIEATITNFPRVNTNEQIARSIAGAHAIAIARTAIENAGLTVLDEPAGRIVRTQKDDGVTRYHPETGYLLRDADFGAGPLPQVVAGLLETNPLSGKANLAGVCGHRLKEQDGVGRWLEAYIRFALLPLLRLFSTTGIALEAHAQNSLVRFVDGWPQRLYVRDLEGIAVDRDVFERCFKVEAAVLDQALFYDRATAWKRLLYYVVVNHFSHVVATVADVSGSDEADLWIKARSALERFSEVAAVQDLLAANMLPAKANLRSCLGGHADMPSYVQIPNPFHAARMPAGLHAESIEYTEARMI